MITHHAVVRASALDIGGFKKDAEEGNVEGIMLRFTSLFAKLPYTTAGGEKADSVIEQNFQNVIYIVFILLGQYAQVEQHSAFGRADCIVQKSAGLPNGRRSRFRCPLTVPVGHNGKVFLIRLFPHNQFLCCKHV